MSAAKQADRERTDPPALVEALRLLASGLWPVPIHALGEEIETDDGEVKVSKGKEPIGAGWGRVRHTEATLRAVWSRKPDAAVGLKLGVDAGVVDLDIDDPAQAEPVLTELFAGECPATMGWSSRRGGHLVFNWDDRLTSYGKTIINFPGVAIRVGSAKPGGQFQSVVPPSPNEDGTPRTWNGSLTIADLPDSVFAYLDSCLKAPVEVEPRTIPLYTPPPGRWSAGDRARAYLAKIAPAVSGSRGHDKTFNAACNAGPGFGLSPEEFTPILREWNQACQPPWSEKELQHKVADAYKKETRRGWKLGEDRNGDFVNSAILLPVETFPAAEEWDPLRLWDPLPPEPFPLDVFPASLAELCQEASAAMQCPPDYFGGAALALAGAAMGLSVSLIIKPTWIEAPNLYLAIVGPPGSKKSPALKLMARPLYQIDADLRDRYHREATQYEEDQREHEANRKKCTADAPPVAPVPIQLTMDDVTREALAHIHSENPRGLAVVMDELTAWVANLDAYRGGKGADKQFWLKVNSGSLVKVSRRGTREAIVIPHPCITVVGGLTPGMISGIRSDDRDDGWIDRILFTYPDPAYRAKRWVERDVPPDLIDEWGSVVRRLWDRPLSEVGGRPGPFLVRMSEEAHRLWIEWFDRHNAEQEDPEFPPHLRGPWSKLEGFAGRLALILSQIHQAYDPTCTGPPRDVEPLDVWGAAKLTHYFKVHFRRARAELSRQSGDESEEARAIIRWIKLARFEFFSGRDVSRQFHRFEDHERSRALAWLCSRNVIRQRIPEPKPEGRAGRKHSLIYDVNPELFDLD